MKYLLEDFLESKSDFRRPLRDHPDDDTQFGTLFPFRGKDPR